MLSRCGPKSRGLEGLGALAAGGAAKSAAASLWSAHGGRPARQEAAGRAMGSPGRAEGLQVQISKLGSQQKGARPHDPRRARQEAHEGIRALFCGHILPFINAASRCGPHAGCKRLQCACISMMQLATASRGGEVLSLSIEGLILTGSAEGSPAAGELPKARARRHAMTCLRLKEGVHMPACGVNALLGWLCAMRARGIAAGPLLAHGGAE